MSSKRILIILAIIVAAAAAVILLKKSPEGNGDSAQTLVFAVENDLTSLDPTKAQEPYTLRVIGQVLEGLVTLDAAGEIQPALAESWTSSENYESWRFKIRKGVMFHESSLFGGALTRELNADDVVFSFQRILSKDSYPAFVLADIVKGVSEFQSGEADSVVGVKKMGDDEVEFTLIRPEPQFLNRITSPWFTVYPKEVEGLEPGVFGTEQLVGTGPFALTSRKDEEAIMNRTENYWKDVSGNIEELRFRVFKNDQIGLSEFENGRVDVLRLPMKMLPVIAEDTSAGGEITLNATWQERAAVETHSTFNSHFLGLNCEKYDKHLRRAVNLAVDRDELVSVITNGTAIARGGTLPGSLKDYSPPPAPDRDLEKARAELALSKFDPATQDFEILVHEKESAEQIGELLQSQLGELGIKAQLTKLDYNNVIGKMISGEFDSFVLSFEYVFSAPGTILNNVFHSEKIPVPNFWRYNNAEVDAAIDKFQTTPELSDANVRAFEIEEMMAEDPPAAFFFEKVTPVLHSKGITGLKFNGHSIPLLWEAKSQ